jgi:hypothetical protein
MDVVINLHLDVTVLEQRITSNASRCDLIYKILVRSLSISKVLQLESLRQLVLHM